MYCDESGNTGTNHLDDDQPYYVLAGWIIAEEDLTAARDTARAALRPSQANQRELKGTDLMKTVSGRARVAALAEGLGAVGALPYFHANYKRFSLAGRFVDYFLDPHDNPNVWPEWFGSRDIRRGFADGIAALPLNVLQAIQEALRGATVEDAEKCVVAVRDALRVVGNESLAQKVDGIVGRTASAIAGVIAKDVSPNFSSFVTALQSLGVQARAKGFGLRFVHDETSSFEATFVESYETLSHLDPASPLGTEIERV